MNESSALDALVRRTSEELENARVPNPRALVLLATGLDLLPERLEQGGSFDFSQAPDVPGPWSDTQLFHGTLGGLPVWVLEDASLDPRRPADQDAQPWHAGFPIWLAAKAGATAMLHASAGAALDASHPVGSLAVLADHLNLSGASPLTGLGESALGPLFPDTTHLHDPALRALATRVAGERGLVAAEAIAACVPAPHLDTPAELRFHARAGAQVSVQGLAVPLLAAAHAGLATCAVVAITDGPQERLDVRKLLERAESIAPGLEELLVELCGECAKQGVLDQEDDEA